MSYLSLFWWCSVFNYLLNKKCNRIFWGHINNVIQLLRSNINDHSSGIQQWIVTDAIELRGSMFGKILNLWGHRFENNRFDLIPLFFTRVTHRYILILSELKLSSAKIKRTWVFFASTIRVNPSLNTITVKTNQLSTIKCPSGKKHANLRQCESQFISSYPLVN